MRLVFLGPPGAGKGTHAKILSERYQIPHISTGDILRSKIKDGSEIGKKAKQFMESGGLVPDEVVIDMVTERLQEPDTKKGFLLDGFPRTLNQAKAFDLALSQLEMKLDSVLYFKASLETLLMRLTGRRVCSQCGATYHVKNLPPKKEGFCDFCENTEIIQRKDDNEDTIKNRLDVYDKDTAPLINFYKSLDVLSDMNADLDVEELDIDLEKVLAPIVNGGSE